ncbi:tRNA (adenosine(37)-N6)-dimethylallyltransferase MiaA [Egicoccus sp. AB-alg2]|uniref:tRNA (adenosine(37)-N6)-dimethylallyltransferase MiaA n=1 Tax=Egicoccus sp. AB-alg2 TaxID=3242693 RepID=UPI00359E7428
MTPVTSPVLAVVGPTASGKSSLALDVARTRSRAGRPTELVAVDAFTVYRGLDIGTAKPTAAEQAEIPHHGLDLCDPWEEVTVAWFQTRVRAAVADVAGRGATPLLVGGSGLYFRAVVDDLRFPPTDPDVRAALEARWWEQPAAAHAHLATLDPTAAARIEPANVRRTVRALEVIELTGERFSAFHDAWQHYTSIYPDLRVAYLEPPAAELRARIHRRADQMVADGLLDEVAALRAAPRGLSSTAAKAIGYAEAADVLDGTAPREGLAAAIAKRTWSYAKRQRSWFRADPRCVPTPPTEVLAAWTPDPPTPVPMSRQRRRPSHG